MVKNIPIHNPETDTELDLKLKQIIKETRSYPEKSLNRRRALNRLLIAVQQSGQLSHPQKGLWQEPYYQYLRDEAISKTLASIYKNLDRYDEKYSVMQWVNGILKNRFIDVLRAEKPKQNDSWDDLLVEPKIPSKTEEQAKVEREMIKECIENSSALKEKHIRDLPKATLAAIVVMKYFENLTLKEIAEHFQIPKHSTVASFLARNISPSTQKKSSKPEKLSKFQDALRKCLGED